MSDPTVSSGDSTSLVGFFKTIIFGLAFGIGFVIASNVLGFIVSLLHR